MPEFSVLGRQSWFAGLGLVPSGVWVAVIKSLGPLPGLLVGALDGRSLVAPGVGSGLSPGTDSSFPLRSWDWP